MIKSKFSWYATVPVTGGAGGLGFEAARALLEHGVLKVALFDINTSVGHEAVGRLRASFPSADVAFMLVDVTDFDIVNAAVDGVVEEFGRIDILLAFAGIVKCEHALEMSVQAWQRVLDVNLTGSFLCAQAVARYECGNSDDNFFFTPFFLPLRNGSEKSWRLWIG